MTVSLDRLQLALSPWSWRPLSLGVSRLDFRTDGGVELVLELSDGGGFVRGLGVWRLAGRVVAIVEAGQG